MRAMVMVVRGDCEEREGREGGQEGPVVSKKRVIALVFGGIWLRSVLSWLRNKQSAHGAFAPNLRLVGTHGERSQSRCPQWCNHRGQSPR